ncbi:MULTISPECIES: TauD/TfdA family dioxygenase [Pseudoalteromonas]|uniref:TauD/TfdA family dioxygenase n=1 Tax=Pseudoalteromonas TaxID=53246 RepID=UPI00029B343F|nr:MULTISPECIES: TauD/TfdA family dioxygenase [Pseudoalteromonas]AUJ69083.1 peptide synthase [Pseudoalteromonas sp. NC201]MBR8843003.1 TauD/TfdA family dioxygenase [Pseudoalteromonas sp. JC3]MCF2829693.1 TauD/TfdA family dioxygenase [Pseudoalteromonas sp. OF5H-5]MCF2831987.1 TauD/TfdA family dioxygenase [Pseudoalteromonas sp. DL2-H6]MCF2927540.1 TauD/TfdA family dioxygenase [Pseudoalteromonas sp. DL2-H1]
MLKTKPLPEARDREVLLEVELSGMKSLDWVTQHKEQLNGMLDEHGMLLIRGLNVVSSKQFGQALSTLFGCELASYQYRSTPRTELRGNVYTATEYHHDEVIPQHNECSYANKWPQKLGFFCMLPAGKGGATPLADSRAVYEKLPAEIRAKFESKQIMYVRNYSDIDLPWTEVFQTDSKEDVERFCHENGFEFEWFDNELRTKQVNQAAIEHPLHGFKVWFNQAHLFHISSLDPETKQSFLSMFGTERLPRNTYFGDGSDIPEADLAKIREIYEQEMFHFNWQKGDVLLLDNLRFTHGRQPFEGARKVLVGMA